MSSAKSTFLYLNLSEQLEKLILDGVYQLGDKLPSVRVMSRERGISMSTVFQAYYQLESRGLIESRPKSGYYVRYNVQQKHQPPKAVYDIELADRPISIDEMLRIVYGQLNAEAVVSFSMGAPDISLLPVAKLDKSIRHAITQHPKHCLNYEDIPGNPNLRNYLARMAFNWGGDFTAEDVVVTAGCMESVANCLDVLTQPGDTVAVESPTYFGLLQLLQEMQLQVLEVPTDPVHGIDLNVLESAFQNQTTKLCVLVPNFSNPLGALMTDEHKRQVVQMLEKYNAHLIESDLYGELYFGKQRPRTCKSFDQNDRVLYCSSVSKSLAPGYRIGWSIAGKYTPALIKRKLVRSVSTCTLSQVVMAHFLETGRYDLHLRKLRQALHVQSMRYLKAISDYFPQDIRITQPRGSLYFWVELEKGIDAFNLHQQAMQQNISIAPGQLFSISNAYQHCFRMSFGQIFNDEIDTGLYTLGQIIKKNKKK